MPSPRTQAWDPMPDETSKALEAFAVYRDMGTDRTIRETSEIMACSESYCQTLSKKHNWVRRAKAWDGYLDRQKQLVTARAVRKVRKNALLGLEDISVRVLEHLKMTEPDKISLKEAAQAIEIITKCDLLLNGEPTDIVENKVSAKDELKSILDRISTRS